MAGEEVVAAPAEGKAETAEVKETRFSHLQNYLQTELNYGKFAAQLMIVVFVSWVCGYLAASFAWVVAVAFLVSKYWYNLVTIFIDKQTNLSEVRKTEASAHIHKESAEWANLIVDRWFRFGESAIFKMLVDNLNPLLASCKPVFLEKLEVGKFTLGSSMPRIHSLHVYDMGWNPAEAFVVHKLREQLATNDTYNLVMEFNMEYNSPDFLLDIVGRLRSVTPEQLKQQLHIINASRLMTVNGLNFSVSISHIKFAGRCQVVVTLDKNIPFPHMQQMSVMFLDEVPDISMSINTFHANIMALPKFNDWLDSIIKASLADYMYYPHRYVIPMYSGEQQVPGGVVVPEEGAALHVSAAGSSKACGLLIVGMRYGTGGVVETSVEDPIWCSVKLESEGQTSRLHPGNQPWNETMAFLVYNLETSKLNVSVKCKSMLGKVTLAEYTVSLGKLDLKDGVEMSITPPRKLSKKVDMPELSFALTLHRLPPFSAMSGQIKMACSYMAEELLNHPDGPERARTTSEMSTGSEDAAAAAAAGMVRSPSVQSQGMEAEDIKYAASGVVSLLVHSASNLLAMDLTGYSDPYVNIFFGPRKIKTCPPIMKTLNPTWNFYCDFLVNDYTSELIKIEVYDWDGLVSKDDFIGSTMFGLKGDEKFEKKTLVLKDETGIEGNCGKIVVSAIYTPFEFLEPILTKPADDYLNFEGKKRFTRKELKNKADQLRSSTIVDRGDCQLTIIRASDLIAADSGGTSDPYCSIFVDGKQVFKTKTIKKTLNPDWSKHSSEISVTFPYPEMLIEIRVNDEDTLKDDFLGRIVLGHYTSGNEDRTIDRCLKRCADSEQPIDLPLKDVKGDAPSVLYFRIVELEKPRTP